MYIYMYIYIRIFVNKWYPPYSKAGISILIFQHKVDLFIEYTVQWSLWMCVLSRLSILFPLHSLEIVPIRTFLTALYSHHVVLLLHYSDIIMSTMAPQITGVLSVCSAVCSGAYQRKHQSSVSLAFVRGIHRWPAASPYKRSVTSKLLMTSSWCVAYMLCVNTRGVQTLFRISTISIELCISFSRIYTCRQQIIFENHLMPWIQKRELLLWNRDTCGTIPHNNSYRC